MQIIIKGRGQGKTTKLLELAKAENLLLVVVNKSEVIRIKSMNLDVLAPITFTEFKRQVWRGRNDFSGFAFDNADLIMPYCIWVEKWKFIQTFELIQIAAKEWAYIATDSFVTSKLVNNIACLSGLDIPYPVTYNEIAGLSKAKKVLINDPIKYIQNIAGRFEIKYITVTE